MAPTNDAGDAAAAATTDDCHMGEDGDTTKPVIDVSMLDNGYSTITTNGISASIPESTDASAHAALQRSLDLLNNMDAEAGTEEIKKLDSQIDHFNNYLDKFEAKNNELNKKLNELLEVQKEERLKRRASFQQREAENKEQNDSLRDQMQALLNRCQMARRSTVAEVAYQAADGNNGMETTN